MAISRWISVEGLRHALDSPEPLGPISATASPARTSRLKLSKIVFGPYARRSPDPLRTVGRVGADVRLATASIVLQYSRAMARRELAGNEFRESESGKGFYRE